MRSYLILCVICFIGFIGLSQSYGNRPKPEWNPPKPEWNPPKPEWNPPKPQPEWSAPKPQSEWSSGSNWGAPEWEPEPEQNQWYPSSEPKPKKSCKSFPNAVNVVFTPTVVTSTTSDSIYPCDSNSVIKQISYQATGDTTVTCNGVVVTAHEADPGDYYDVVFRSGGYGDKHKERVQLANYTWIDTWNNGNHDYLECGTISSGRCSGDSLWGVGIYENNDQNGCSKHGITGLTALVRIIEVRGKCASRCSLGSSTLSLATPVNNKGAADRSVSEDEIEE